MTRKQILEFGIPGAVIIAGFFYRLVQIGKKRDQAEAQAARDRLAAATVIPPENNHEHQGDTERLSYLGVSTGITASFNRDVMLFPRAAADPEFHTAPSNTGIFTRGPFYGFLTTEPGQRPNCAPDLYNYFLGLAAGWMGQAWIYVETGWQATTDRFPPNKPVVLIADESGAGSGAGIA